MTAAIAASVSAHDHEVFDTNKAIQEANGLLRGYRAAYWAVFDGIMVVCVAIFLGLRKLGKVGVKHDQDSIRMGGRTLRKACSLRL